MVDNKIACWNDAFVLGPGCRDPGQRTWAIFVQSRVQQRFMMIYVHDLMCFHVFNGFYLCYFVFPMSCDAFETGTSRFNGSDKWVSCTTACEHLLTVDPDKCIPYLTYSGWLEPSGIQKIFSYNTVSWQSLWSL